MPSSSQSQGARTHVRAQVVAFLCALSFLTYYDRQCIVRATESIQQTLAIDDEQMGIVLGAFWLAYALFDIPGGWLGDRFGARFTLTRIVFAWSLFTALTGAATGFYSLLVYRFLFGVGEAGAFPNMARVQSRWLPIVERARAGGLIWMAARWGAAFAPLIFGAITRGIESLQMNLTASSTFFGLAALPPWRIAFLASGVLGIIWCLAFYPWFRDEPAQKPSVSQVERTYIETSRGAIETHHHVDAGVWTSLLSSPSLWAIGLYYICGSFGWSFFVSWMPLYMKDVQGVSFQQSEWLTALPLFCGGVACIVGGAWSDAFVKRSGRRRLGRALFPIIGCLAAAIAMLAIPHANTAASATVLMCVAAAGFDFGQAANFSAIVDIGGRNAGLAMGFINSVGCLSHAVQPYVGARVFHAFGWNTLFGVYAAAFLLAMAAWTMVDPTKRFYDSRVASERG